MFVPFDQQQRMHPEYAGYAGARIKQADVVLLSYPLMLGTPRTFMVLRVLTEAQADWCSCATR